MAISATELSNTLATQFDVELVFYAGQAYKDLTLSDYAGGAVDPSTSGWTNVSSSVLGNGNLVYERSGNTLSWRATISGVNYNDTYFGPGQAIMCLRRATVGGVQTIPATGTYELWFVGQIIDVSHDDTYTHRKGWQCTIGGLDTLLQRSTAPRIAAGKINILSNGSVEASSTLLTPALEAGTGEFAGTLVNVDPANTIDNNLNTLWISNVAPTSASTNLDYGITKLFVNPLAGYDQSKLWWFEWRVNDPATYNEVHIRNQDGYELWIDCTEHPLYNGKYYIFCADLDNFNAYTGGGNGIAEIIDVKSLRQTTTGSQSYQVIDVARGTWQLSASTGWFQTFDNTDHDAVWEAVAWDDDGTTQDPPDTDGWSGSSIVVGGASPGYGWLKTGSSGTASGYVQTKHMYPGDYYDEVTNEWLMFTPEPQSAALSGSIAASSTSVTLSTTLGLLDSGSAVCEANIFTYTGRTATTLTGLPATGAYTIDDHADGAAVNQVINDVMQTGWPCSRVELLRPINHNLEQIGTARIYTAQTGAIAPLTPDDEDWEGDWSSNVQYIFSSDPNEELGIRDYGISLTADDGSSGPRWIQYLLVYFSWWTNGARARMNEVKLFLSQTQVDNSGLGDIDSVTACALAQYIFDQAGTSTYLARGTSLDFGPWIGEHATAIAPYTDVLDDLARITGCCIHWRLDGIPHWRNDMWWPYNLSDSWLALYADLDATHIRGQVNYSGRKPNEVGVKIHARTPDNIKQYNAEFPIGLTAADQFLEYDDLVIASSDIVSTLAQTLFYKAGLFYQNGSQEATFILKGIGEWLEPDRWIRIFGNTDTGEIAIPDNSASNSYVSWLIESVTWSWNQNDKRKDWQATAKCRRYWQ